MLLSKKHLQTIFCIWKGILWSAVLKCCASLRASGQSELPHYCRQLKICTRWFWLKPEQTQEMWRFSLFSLLALVENRLEKPFKIIESRHETTKFLDSCSLGKRGFYGSFGFNTALRILYLVKYVVTKEAGFNPPPLLPIIKVWPDVAFLKWEDVLRALSVIGSRRQWQAAVSEGVFRAEVSEQVVASWGF